MSKKRRLSPSASSRSSNTPAPTTILPPAGVPLPPPTTLAHSSSHDALSVPGPSRTSGSASATPAPSLPREERTAAKMGVLTPGSGDGPGCGDECFLWGDLPMNKQGFRYAPCTPSPTPSPSPLFPFYRTLPAAPPTPPVHISWLDRSSFLRISPTALTVSTDRGFRSARANVGVRQGSWYYEAVIERGAGSSGGGGGTGGEVGNPHVRLGWARREANLDAPVGMDAYGYGIRDVGGDKVHLSRPKPYGRELRTGDVVGCLIRLPPRTDDVSTLRRKRTPIRWKGQLYFEMDEYAVQKEMEALVDREGKGAAAAKAAAEAAKLEPVEEEKLKAMKKGATTKNAKKGKKNAPSEPSGPVIRHLPTLTDSSVEFFLNGESLGTAFQDIYDFAPLPTIHVHSNPAGRKAHEPPKEAIFDDGTLGYYPMISCFGRGKLRCNFGPDWLHPPPGLSARPMSERYEKFRQEEVVLDERDEVDSAERLKKEMAEDAIRRQAAEVRPAAMKGRDGSGTPKRKVVNKKKRKGTDTPGPDGLTSRAGTGTPGPELSGLGTEVKMEVDEGTPKSKKSSRAGTEEIKREVEEDGEETKVDGIADADGEEDREEGMQWG